MRRDALSLFAGTAIAAFGIPSAPGQVLWINEFHYDNTGTDVGEFVEILAPADFADLASVRLTLYNGGDGQPYGTPHLLSSFTQGATVAGYTLYSKAIAGLQNGAPDGLALDRAGSLLQFLSYEGAFTASSGPASGATSLNIGVAESEATPSGASLGLAGTGLGPGDFTWFTLGAASPGLLNPGQAVVPEPAEYAALAGAGLAAFAVWRRRHARRRVAG